MDISLLLSYHDSHGAFQDAQQQQQTSLPPRSAPLGSASEQLPGPLTRKATLPHVANPPSNAAPSTISQPAAKQVKWSPEEDSLIIELRGSGMKWEDVSKQLPGRSAVACRLHYQNYLERRSEWDEEQKNKLARLYERYLRLSDNDVTRDPKQSLTDLPKPVPGSRPRCGPKSLKSFRYPGEQLKQCIGSLERSTWLVELAWFHFL